MAASRLRAITPDDLMPHWKTLAEEIGERAAKQNSRCYSLKKGVDWKGLLATVRVPESTSVTLESLKAVDTRKVKAQGQCVVARESKAIEAVEIRMVRRRL